jgi:hypothetical protein
MANPVMAALPWYDQILDPAMVWYALGLGAGAALCVVDYHTLARWSLCGLLGDDFLFGRRAGSAHRLDAASARGAGLIWPVFPISAERICQAGVHPRLGANF